MLLFYDPCDHYTDDVAMQRAGFTIENPANVSQSSAGGRTGAGHFAVADAGEVGVVFPASTDVSLTFFVSFAFRLDALPTVANDFVELLSESGSSEIVNIRISPIGAIQVWKGGGIIGTTGPGLISAGTWYHLEVQVVVDDTAGVVRLVLGDAEALNLTAQNTSPGGGLPLDEVDFVVFHRGGDAGGAACRFDDIALWDAEAGPTGDPFTTSQGDIRMASLTLNADAQVDPIWVNSGVGAAYEDIDDPIPGAADGDASYIESSGSAGGSTEWALFAHAGSPSDVDEVLAFGMMAECRRTAVNSINGGSGVDFAVRGDVSNDDAGTVDTSLNPLDRPNISPPSGQTYAMERGASFQDPSAGAQWTKAGVDDGGVGIVIQLPV